MTRVNRRRFLQHSASLPLLLGATANQARASDAHNDLVSDPKGVLDLPPEFSYRIVSRRGESMSDGYRTPGNPDAMGMFTLASGELALMRNHEVTMGDSGNAAFDPGKAPREAYDPEGYGGVSRLVLDPNTLHVKRSNLVLAGTFWNCAGGLSPWGWLSCEEVFIPEHGYVFLCPTDVDRVAKARAIKSYGRFRHEAATVDPKTNIAYLTEDMEDASFYRFLPERTSEPFVGKLQALAIKGHDRFDTGNMALHDKLPVHWVDVAKPDSDDNDVRYQAQARGAARFMRTEGLWLADNHAYLCATIGGPINRGQVFRLKHRPEGEAELELLAHTTDTSVLDMPDNITVSPDGHVYVVEDGAEGNYIRRITETGAIVDVARNVFSGSELAGPCFTPDGKTLFVNIQHDGLTLAISGPFAARAAQTTKPEHSAAARPKHWGDGAVGIGTGLALIAIAALNHRKRTVR